VRVYKFGTCTLPEPEGESQFTVNGRNIAVDLPYGTFDPDGGPLVLKASDVTHKCRLIAPVDAKYDELARTMGLGRNVLYAQMWNGDRRCTYAKMTSLSHIAIARNYPSYQDVTLKFSLDSPYWWDINDVSFLDQGQTLDSGLIMDGHFDTQTITTSPYTWTLINSGTAQADGGYMLIQPNAASSMSNITIEDTESGANFNWNGTLNANDRLEFDFLAKTVQYNGVDAYGSFAQNSNQIEWLLLALGNNSMKLTAGAIAGTVKLYHRWSKMFL